MSNDGFLAGSTIKEVRWMTEEEKESMDWSEPTTVLVMHDGWRYFVSQDEELNGPGTIIHQGLNLRPGSNSFMLIGEVVRELSGTTQAEKEFLNGPAIAILMQSGQVLLPAMDEELNGPGVWCAMDGEGTVYTYLEKELQK